VVVLLDARVGDDADGHLALALVGVDLDAARDLGHDGRVLGLAGLEDLGDAGQTTDDVLRCRPAAAGLAGEHLAGLDLLPVLRLRDAPWRAGSGSRGCCPSSSTMLICGCRSPLCSMTTRAFWPRRRPPRGRSRRPRCRRTSHAVLLGEDGRAVRVPLDERLALLHLVAVLGVGCTRRRGPCTSRARGPWRRAPRARRCASGTTRQSWPSSSLWARRCSRAARRAGVLARGTRSLTRALADAAGVERTHRQLRAGLADRLGGDDAHRHARLDELARGHVHAVVEHGAARAALAGQGRADHDRVDAEVLDRRPPRA
jgi:hypothetical protein